MEERNELIKELFELHKLLADKGEVSIGYGFSENYNRLEAKVKKLTIPVVVVPKSTFYCRNKDATFDKICNDQCKICKHVEYMSQ